MVDRVKTFDQMLKVHRAEFDIVDWSFDMKALLNNLNWICLPWILLKMQSTSSVKSSLSVLIKNFFIAGLSQDTLRNRVDMKFSDQINIEPEVLFSMY